MCNATAAFSHSKRDHCVKEIGRTSRVEGRAVQVEAGEEKGKRGMSLEKIKGPSGRCSGAHPPSRREARPRLRKNKEGWGRGLRLSTAGLNARYQKNKH